MTINTFISILRINTFKRELFFFLVSIIFTLSTFGAFAKTSRSHAKYVTIVKITGNINIGYKKYDKKFKVYYDPMLLKNGKSFLITGLDKNKACDVPTSLSPNKKYCILPVYEIGYVGSGKDRFLHENSFCYLINIETCKVELQLQSDCGGEWNEKNQWMNNNKIVFDGQ